MLNIDLPKDPETGAPAPAPDFNFKAKPQPHPQFASKFAEAQAILDQALSSAKIIKLTFSDLKKLSRFRVKIYKLKTHWRETMLKVNGGYTPRPIDPANLVHIDPALLAQLKEVYPNAKTIARYHWQSPYEWIQSARDESGDPILYVFNTMFQREPGSSILSIEEID